MRNLATFFAAVLVLTVVEEGSATDVSCFYWAGPSFSNMLSDLVTPEDIDASLCSHLVYMSAIMDFYKLQITSSVPENDLYDNGGSGRFNRTVALKRSYPSLKVLLHLRFQPYSTTSDSKVAFSAVERQALIRNSIDFLEAHGFDGIDLGWLPLEMENKDHIMLLLTEMHEEFTRRNFTISIWLEPEDTNLDSDVLKNINRNVDIIYLKTLNYGGPFYFNTAIVAPISLMNRTVHTYMDKGVDKRKMSVMIASYAFAFVLKNIKNNGIGAETRGQDNDIPYYELVRRLRDQSEGWVLEREETSNQPWGVSNDTWISYEDPSSISKKAEFVIEAGLGGATMFPVNMDDFRDSEDSSVGRFPLTRALHQVLTRK